MRKEEVLLVGCAVLSSCLPRTLHIRGLCDMQKLLDELVITRPIIHGRDKRLTWVSRYEKAFVYFRLGGADFGQRSNPPPIPPSSMSPSGLPPEDRTDMRWKSKL